MIDLLQNIAKNVPQGALLGLDIGKKTIGIAVCDSAHSIATPLTTVNRTKFSKDIKHLERLMRDYEIVGVVIGYPLNMDGSIGPRCQATRDFAQELKAQISNDLQYVTDWIALQDERLSTASVEDFVDRAVDGSRRKAKEKGIIDKLAAQVILQSALDYLDRHDQ